MSSFPSPDVSVAVLAGGAARRLGGRKADRILGSRRLVDYAIDLAEQVSRDVVFLPGSRQLEMPEGVHVRKKPDWAGGAGPLAGIVAGLNDVQNRWCLVLSCDMPNLSLESLLPLFGRCEATTADAVLWSRDGDVEPFPGFYQRNLAPQLLRFIQSGGQSLKGWIETLDVNCVPFEGASSVLMNVNERDELAKARSGWAQ